MSDAGSRRPPLRLGLTGGIGSGKSTVARMLQQCGASLIDADAISHACTAAGGSAIPAILETFGPEFLTPEGALDRQRMRERVFEQPQARQQLEQIVHPLIRTEIDRQYLAVTSDCAVFDLPLLVESPQWRDRVDTLWVVDCAPETQIQRVMARNGWPEAQVRSVLAAQASRAQRLAAADTVIDNDHSDLPALEAQVQQAYARTRAAFGL